MNANFSVYDLGEAKAIIDAVIAYRAANPLPQIGPPILPPSDPAPVDARGDAQPARKRRTKAEIEAAKAAEPQSAPATNTPPPAAPATQALAAAFEAPPAPSSFLDDDEPEPAPTRTYSKDDVRAALVALQLKRTGEYRAKGQNETDAAKAAEAATKKVLLDASGSERLGGVPETAYGVIVEAANKAAAQSV